jgi:hypothetical protein
VDYLCFELKRYWEAEELWREKLTGRRATQGDTHIDTLNVISSLAGLQEKLGRYEESIVSATIRPYDNSSEVEAIPDLGGDPTYRP